MTDLGFVPTAIDDNNQIVGGNNLYEDGQLFNLYDLIQSDTAYEALVVEDIDNAGQIVGTAEIDGTKHALLPNPPPLREGLVAAWGPAC